MDRIPVTIQMSVPNRGPCTKNNASVATVHHSVKDKDQVKESVQVKASVQVKERGQVKQRVQVAADLGTIMNKLHRDAVKRHFILCNDGAKNSKEIEPFLLCEGISVDVFNQYIEDCDEKLPIALRFLELDKDGRLLIVEYPSTVHEVTVEEFKTKFLHAFGDTDYIAKKGSTTARRDRFPDKEADAAFGPLNNTTPPPHLKRGADWITFAVEVGYSQTWESLKRAAEWWYGYVGIQYILLLKVSTAGDNIRYGLYDVVGNEPEILPPAPSQEGYFQLDPNGAPEYITLNNRRLLSIPTDQALPPGVNDFSVVNLRNVMRMVIRSLPV